MKKGFAYIPLIIIVCAVLVFGVVGYFAIHRPEKEAKLDAPGNECRTRADCAVNSSGTFGCDNGYCIGEIQYNANRSLNQNNVNVNVSLNTNAVASPNTNSIINQNANTGVNQNTNTAPVTAPRATLISSSAKDGYINLAWKTDLPTNTTVGFREKGGTWLGGPETGDVMTRDPYNHTTTIPNIRSGKTIEYYFHSCADLLKWRACRTACGGGESCDRGCTASTMNNCADSQTWSIVMPEYITPAPKISNIQVRFYLNNDSNAYVHWDTDYQASGIVNYGPTSSYGSSEKDRYFGGYGSYQMWHDSVFAVTAGTTYHYSIQSCTDSGKCTNTLDATFTAP